VKPGGGFEHVDGRDVFQVTGRHVRPCTDELLLSVMHRTTGGGRSALLARPDVVRLRDWLDRWLAEGWDGVPRQCGDTYKPDRFHEWQCDRDPDGHPASYHEGRAVGWAAGETPCRERWPS
jgi:hypothetical protein